MRISIDRSSHNVGLRCFRYKGPDYHKSLCYLGPGKEEYWDLRVQVNLWRIIVWVYTKRV